MASNGLKNFSRVLLHALFVFANMLRSMGISQSKRDGRATHHSVFIVTNATRWSFFSFDTHFEPKVIKKRMLVNGWFGIGAAEKNFWSTF